jgi:hypothetical protein
LLGIAGVAAGGIAIAAGSKESGTGSTTIDITLFYGAFANAAFVGQGASCSGFSASFAISGNADGSAFQPLKTFPGGVRTFLGTIQPSGAFSGSGEGYSISGQTTGSHISGTETQAAAPPCTWTFDGSR